MQVTVTANQKLSIGERIKQDGLWYQDDGKDLVALMRLFHQEAPTLSGKPLENYLKLRLVEYDKMFGWDHKDQTQAIEEQVFGMFAQLYAVHLA